MATFAEVSPYLKSRGPFWPVEWQSKCKIQAQISKAVTAKPNSLPTLLVFNFTKFENIKVR